MLKVLYYPLNVEEITEINENGEETIKKEREKTNVEYPSYGEVISATAWDGTAEIQAITENEIMIIETDSTGKALKAGKATVTSKA